MCAQRAGHHSPLWETYAGRQVKRDIRKAGDEDRHPKSRTPPARLGDK